MVATTFRTDDVTRWGSGVGRNLTAAEVDGNFYAIGQAISELQTSRPQPNNIASITVTGQSLSVFLDDGTEIGPLPLPVLSFAWRGEWMTSTVYNVLDVFTVEFQGLYLVKILHTSDPTTFDETLTFNGQPAYQKLLGGGPISPPGYDAPADGATVTAAPLVRRHLIDPAGPIATLTIILPPAPADGDDFEVLTSQTITTLTVSPAAAETVLGSGFMLAAQGVAKWVYRAANTTWYGGM